MNAKVEGAAVKEPKPKKEKPVEPVITKPEVDDDDQRVEDMNEHCQRIYNGQSPNLGKAERAARIKGAINNHGWKDLIEFFDIDEEKNPCTSRSNKNTIKYHL